MKPTLSLTNTGLAVLHGLTDADIDWMLDCGLEQEIAPGSLVVSEGTRPDAIFLIASGILSVFLGADGAGRVAVLGPGQIVGEMSFLEDRPSSASVAALETCSVIGLPASILRPKLEADPGFAARFYRSIARLTSKRLRELLGVVGRWSQEAASAALFGTEATRELAAATQQFKETLIAASRKEDAVAAARTLEDAIGEFASLLHRIVGPDSSASLDLRDELGGRAQQELLPFFLKSQIAEHLYCKPRGYALDFQTMDLMAEPARPEDSALNLALRQLPPMAALLHRQRLVEEIIIREAGSRTDGEFYCTSIADSAGRSVFSAIRAMPSAEHLHVNVYDFDTKALDQVVQRAAIAGRAAEFTCHHTHLLALVAGRLQDGGAKQHLVVSAGLPDMLEDRFLLRIINSSFDLLAPGGRLVLGFCHSGRSERSFLHYILGLDLIYRTEGEVNALLTQSHFGCPATTVRFEKEHACFIAECVKPETQS